MIFVENSTKTIRVIRIFHVLINILIIAYVIGILYNCLIYFISHTNVFQQIHFRLGHCRTLE